MVYIIKCRKLVKNEPFIDSKTGKTIDDGEPKDIVLSRENDKKIADYILNNFKNNVIAEKRKWKFWIEENE